MDEKRAQKLQEEFRRWRKAYENTDKRQPNFSTLSGHPVAPVYTPLDMPELFAH